MSLNKYDSSTGELTTLASGTRMWIGTKSAHELAITNGTMPNNVMVCVTDDQQDGNDDYSTDEMKTTRKWIDGKPIYRKVVEKNVNISGNSWNHTGIDVSEIDTLCNCIMLNSKFAFSGFYTKKVSNQLDVYCASDANWVSSTFILEYTKTTD